MKTQMTQVKAKTLMLLLAIPLFTMGNITSCPPGPQGPDPVKCQNPDQNTSCPLVCTTRQNCDGCCDAKGGNVNACKTQCKSKFGGAIVRIRLPSDTDAYTAVVDGQPASDGGNYQLIQSVNFSRGQCVASSTRIDNENVQPIAADLIFQRLPSYMDTIDARGLVDSLNPCERLALLKIITDNQSFIAGVPEDEYQKYKVAFDNLAIDRAIANGQSDPESVRLEFNRAVTEFGYIYLVSPDLSHVVEE